MSAQPNESTSLIQIEGLKMHFPVGSSASWNRFKKPEVVHAVDGIDLEIKAGETLSVIGESGSGKSTLGRTLLRLYEPTAGSVRYRGRDLAELSGSQLRHTRQKMQMVFQNPYSAVNRRKTLLSIIIEPLQVHGIGSKEDRVDRAHELLRLVGLADNFSDRFPHEVSGGQLQRVGIARALATEPDFLVTDEPTASLDVSVRAQVINLLADIKEQAGMTLLFVSHDLSVVSYLSDRIAVMYLGRIVEIGDKDRVEQNPRHPYTRALMDAVPRPDPTQRRDRLPVIGEIPSAVNPPTGCHYASRCPLAMPICATVYPPLEVKSDGSTVACHAVE